MQHISYLYKDFFIKSLLKYLLIMYTTLWYAYLNIIVCKYNKYVYKARKVT